MATSANIMFSSAAPPVQASGVVPFLNPGDWVYLIDQLSTGETDPKQRPHKVLGSPEFDVSTDGADTVFDGTLSSTASDSTIAADVSITGTGSQTAAEWPFFYRVQEFNVLGTAAIGNPSKIPEYKLRTLAGALVALGLVSWSDPA